MVWHTTFNRATVGFDSHLTEYVLLAQSGRAIGRSPMQRWFKSITGHYWAFFQWLGKVSYKHLITVRFRYALLFGLNSMVEYLSDTETTMVRFH